MDHKTQTSPCHDHLLPSNPNHEQEQPSRHSRIMEKLKAAVLFRLSKLNPNKPLSPAQIATVERRLAETFPAFRIPTHLPYETMIPIAIKELNEEGGSSENAISEYILTNYEGLPWAHKRFLSHYLNKLCQKGEIVCISGGLYTFPELTPRTSLKKRQLRRKPGRKRKESVVEEGDVGGGGLMGDKDSGGCFQEEEIQASGKSPGKRRRKLLLSDEDEEGEGTEEVVGKEENLFESNEMLVIGGRNDVLELVGGDEKESKLEKHDAGTVDGVNNRVNAGQGSCEVRLDESTIEKMVPKECNSEVKIEVFDAIEDGEMREAAATDDNNDNNSLNVVITSSQDEKVVTEGGSRVCPHCSKVFHNHRARNGHMQVHALTNTQDKEGVRVCPQCNKEFGKRQALNAHMNSHALNRNQVEEGVMKGGSIICPHCNQGFRNNRALGGHIRVHVKKNHQPKKLNNATAGGSPRSSPPNPCLDHLRPIMCHFYNKEFGSEKLLLEHMRSHPDWKWCGMQPPAEHNGYDPSDPDASEGNKEQLLPLVPSSEAKKLPAEREEEMRTDNLTFDKDPSEGKREPHLPLVPSIEKHMLSTDPEDEVRTERLKLDSERSHDNLILVPAESVNKSTFGPTKGDPIQASVSNVEGDAPSERYMKVALKDKDRNSSAASLMIMPYEGKTPKPAVKKDIVCGLICQEPGQPQKVYRARRRMKNRQGGPPHMFEKSMPTSLVSCLGPRVMEYELLCKVSPQGGLQTEHNLTMLDSSKLKDSSPQSEQAYKPSQHGPTPMISLGSIEHDSEKQKLHSESSLASKSQPTEDDDFNIPLRQLLAMLSSKSGAKLQVELPDSENPSQVTPQRVEEVTFINRNQIQGQQPERQLQSRGPNCRIEPDTFVAPDSETLLSFLLEKGKNNGKYQEHQQKGGQDQGSSPNVELTTETLSLGNQHHELGELKENRQTRGHHDLCSEPGQTMELNLSKSSPTKDNSEQKEQKQQDSEMGEVGYCDSEPVIIREENVLPDNQQLQSIEKQRMEPKREAPGWTPDAICACDCVPAEPSSSLRHDDGNLLTQNQSSKQQIKQPKWIGHGRCPKQKEATNEEAASVICQFDMKKRHGQNNERPPSEQQNIQVHIKHRGRPQKQRGETEDAASSLSLPQQQQEGRSESASIQHSRQNDHAKKDSCGRPIKQIGATLEDKATLLNLHGQQQEEPATSECGFTLTGKPKKDGRGRPRKQKEAAIEDVPTPINLHDQQKKVPSELATHHLTETDGQGVPMEKKESTIAVVAAQLLHDQPATYQLEKKDGPRKEKEATTEDVAAPLNLLDRQQEESSPPNPHGQQQEPEPGTYQLRSKDGRGRPEKQEAAKDVEAVPNSHVQQQEEISVQSSKKKRDGRLRPRKQKEATVENVTAPPNFQDQQQEGPAPPNFHDQQKEKPASPNLHYHQQGPSEGPNFQLKKKNGLGRQKQRKQVPAEDAATFRSLNGQQQKGPVKQSSHQLIKKDGRRLKKHNEATLEDAAAPRNYHNQQQDGPPKPPIHTSLVPSSLLCQLDQKKSQQATIERKVSSPDCDVPATPKAPIFRLTQSSQLRRMQEEHLRDEACKPEAATTFSDSQTGVGKSPKSPPASAVSNNETHQQEKEHKPYQVEKQLQSSDEQPRELHYEVHGAPSEPEPIMILSHDAENQGQLRDQGTVPKQNSAKTKPIQVPLSSKDQLRSRTKRQSQDD